MCIGTGVVMVDDSRCRVFPVHVQVGLVVVLAEALEDAQFIAPSGPGAIGNVILG